MTLLEELAQGGVTAEDLEKAASVRLFEKAASAEGIDLASLNENDVSNLYTHFVEGSLAEEGSDMEKDATIDLFEKVAAHEGLDLSALNDNELGQVYGHFVEEILPGMEEEYEVEEAQAKLAEAEILGRHMARAYVDETEKWAAEGGSAGATVDAAMDKLRGWGASAKQHGANWGGAAQDAAGDTYRAGRGAAGRGAQAAWDATKRRAGQAKGLAGSYGRTMAGMSGAGEGGRQGLISAVRQLRAGGMTDDAAKAVRAAALKAGGRGALAWGGTVGAGVGAKKLYNRREKRSSFLLEDAAMYRAEELLKNASIDEDVDRRALEILLENGYDLDQIV